MTFPSRCVAVFCGSNFCTASEHQAGAQKLATPIAHRGLRLVYGGTHQGLMGVLADAALAAVGVVVGLIKQRLYDRAHLPGHLAQRAIAPHMRARKVRKSELAGAFIALPGGLGTLQELLAGAPLTQFGERHKACDALDLRGFARPLRALLETANHTGFFKPEHRDMLIIEPQPGSWLDALMRWTPPTVNQWIGQPGT